MTDETNEEPDAALLKPFDEGLYHVEIVDTHQHPGRARVEYGIVVMRVVHASRLDVMPGELRRWVYQLHNGRLPLKDRNQKTWEDWVMLSESPRGRRLYMSVRPRDGMYGYAEFSTKPITTREGSDAYRFKQIYRALIAMRAEGAMDEAVSVKKISDQIWERLDEETRSEVRRWIQSEPLREST